MPEKEEKNSKAVHAIIRFMLLFLHFFYFQSFPFLFINIISIFLVLRTSIDFLIPYLLYLEKDSIDFFYD